MTTKKPAPKPPAKPKQPDKLIPRYHIDNKEWDKAAAVHVICEKLANSSEGLVTICKANDDLPASGTVLMWFNSEEAAGGETPLIDMYTRAKAAQADFMADEMLDIADNGRNDWMEKAANDGSVVPVVDHEHIQRSRLRIETRKWIASKLKPKKYGDKLELSGDPERPLSATTDKDLESQILILMRRMQANGIE